MQGVVRLGRYTILPVLLGAHAAPPQMVGSTKVIIEAVAISGSQNVNVDVDVDVDADF